MATPTPTAEVTPTPPVTASLTAQATATPVATLTPTVTPIVSGLPVQKLFMLRKTGNEIRSYTTGRTNVLSTTVYDDVLFDLSTQCVNPQGMFTTVAGTFIFVVDSNIGVGTGTVYKYSLTAWDLNTTAYSNDSIDISVNPVNSALVWKPIDIQMNIDGTAMFILDDVSDAIYEYTLSTPNLLSSATYTGRTLSINRRSEVTFSALSFIFGNRGNKLYIIDKYTLSIEQYRLRPVYDIVTAVYEKTLRFKVADIISLSFNPDGTRIFVDTGLEFSSYELANNWEVDSASLISFVGYQIDGPNVDLNFREAEIAIVSPTPTYTSTVTPTLTPSPTVPPVFESTWQTTGSDDTITLPLVNGGTYSFNVDWGDGSDDDITAWDQLEATHTYSTEDLYTVSITGTIDGFRFNNSGDKLKIRNIESWGPLELISDKWFYGCSSLTVTATDIPTINTTNMTAAFRLCQQLTTIPNISQWNVSAVTVLDSTFRQCTNFNDDLSGWDTSSVTDLSWTFMDSGFNTSLNGWDVSNVVWLYQTFYLSVFNAPLDEWELNTLSAVDCTTMFANTPFNQDISGWNTSAIIVMFEMFGSNTAFNQDISGWDVSSVEDMGFMFNGCTSFDQNLGGWDITSMTDASDMFTGVTLSTSNYDALLIGWEANTHTSSVTFSGGNSQYSAGAAATAWSSLDVEGWTITDGGQVP